MNMDSQYPGYLQVRMNYPLKKALQMSLTVMIKGRGAMVISMRYENVPHFCFNCECMGHATINCEEGEPEDHRVRFGGELRVSPPRCVREIVVEKVPSNVARPPFHGEGSKRMSPAQSFQAESTLNHWEHEEAQKMKAITFGQEQGGDPSKEGMNTVMNDLAKGMEDLQMKCGSASDGYETISRGGKECVSFETNMTTYEEDSDSDNMEHEVNRLDNDVARFHARNFGTKDGRSAEKRLSP
jgi:hypothetical protein